MKIIRKAIILFVPIIALVSCSTMTPKLTETPIPTSIPASTNTPEPVAPATATAVPSPTATDAPVDIHAPYNAEAVPSEDIASALARSENDGKLVLLDFGANWCPDCLVLAVLFEDPGVKPFLQENYHVVRIDVGMWDKNLDVAQKYGNPIENGIPAVVVLAQNGQILATTKDGSLANARTATAPEILAMLEKWQTQKP